MKITKRLLTLTLAIALTFVFLAPVSADAACSHSSSIFTGQTQSSQGSGYYHTVQLVTGTVTCAVTETIYHNINKCTSCGAYFPVYSHTTYSHSRNH